MPIDPNTYGTVAGVEAYVGDLVGNRQFDDFSIPTKTQLETILNDMAALLNAALEQQNVTIPVTAAAEPTTHAVLTYGNNVGAASKVLATKPTESFSSVADEEIAKDRRVILEREFRSIIKMVRDGKLKFATDRLQNVFVGSQEDADGNKTLPIFTRDIFDYPGVRSLTE